MGRNLTASATPPSRSLGRNRRFLVLSAIGLGAWLAFLVYQVIWFSNPVLLARPQVLTAPIIVEGDVTADGKFRVERDWWKASSLVGSELDVIDLPESTAQSGFIVLLEKVGNERYRLWRAPNDPGFPLSASPPVFYPRNRASLQQLAELLRVRR